MLLCTSIRIIQGYYRYVLQVSPLVVGVHWVLPVLCVLNASDGADTSGGG